MSVLKMIGIYVSKESRLCAGTSVSIFLVIALLKYGYFLPAILAGLGMLRCIIETIQFFQDLKYGKLTEKTDVTEEYPILRGLHFINSVCCVVLAVAEFVAIIYILFIKK